LLNRYRLCLLLVFADLVADKTTDRADSAAARA